MSAPVDVRIARGRPTEEEVAAVALVLALVGLGAARGRARGRYATWERLERLPRYASPSSWRHRS
ncbi:acyl-CoA carboxylase epsilon subunit [Streptomyces sp. BH097]|uniref:acyl-CoA carboxylase epsilon subunit n=1 Tax=unclassified Streptomyces TaxID=2593676 RepID=UPI003BB5BB08